MKRNLVFYDGTCGFCDIAVQFLLGQDTEQRFVFAPLQGTTAKIMLKDLPESLKNSDSLVLVENYQAEDRKFYVLGRGAFRILWMLGGAWSLLGWVSFLPSFLYNWGYRIVARNRHKLFPNTKCILPDANSKDRFLP
jgi:predicted DCC family thiol-disulfide oxidoreductase YuxK